jgi:hypothetical protein
MRRGWIIDRLNDHLALTGGTMSGPIQMGGSRVRGMADPAAADDAATKGYVDGALAAATAALSTALARIDQLEAQLSATTGAT